jgi:predicted XRE-type DNA-binding protein
MDKRRFASVWDAIEDDAETAQAMKRRSALLTALKRQTAGLSAEQVAHSLGVDRQQAQALKDGKIGQFDLEELQAISERGGRER